MELATLAVAMNSARDRSDLSLAAIKQNADFQRQTVETLLAVIEQAPKAPADAQRFLPKKSSVTETAICSPETTTSPRAMGLPLARMVTGSLSLASSSITAPRPIFSS